MTGERFDCFHWRSLFRGTQQVHVPTRRTLDDAIVRYFIVGLRTRAVICSLCSRFHVSTLQHNATLWRAETSHSFWNPFVSEIGDTKGNLRDRNSLIGWLPTGQPVVNLGDGTIRWDTSRMDPTQTCRTSFSIARRCTQRNLLIDSGFGIYIIAGKTLSTLTGETHRHLAYLSPHVDIRRPSRASKPFRAGSLDIELPVMWRAGKQPPSKGSIDETRYPFSSYTVPL
ncbi:hypothetical protein F4782DRAFT_214443 [Xylaria castorea]|nr:hypothetical protein F4782DRAFT_214443 [Xylaria castorea]